MTQVVSLKIHAPGMRIEIFPEQPMSAKDLLQAAICILGDNLVQCDKPYEPPQYDGLMPTGTAG